MPLISVLLILYSQLHKSAGSSTVPIKEKVWQMLEVLCATRQLKFQDDASQHSSENKYI